MRKNVLVKSLSENLKQQVEALLFATQGLTVKKMCETLNNKPKNVLRALKKLREDYSKRDSAFIITNINDVWKLTVHSEHVPVVKDLIPSEFPKSLMETLAVIAWKNPADQSDVVKVRGNKAYNHIKQLEDYGLISSKPKGRTKELKLTDKFYEYFNAEPGEIKDKFKP
ncbi:SMC-Scp complex subunit ScpB [archaeon]|nr:SMC-Scp complex subunit ScpB [archaeon]